MIEFGKEYKYKELCKELEIEPKRGSYQISQLNKLYERYDIEKLPNKKYVVHKEYTNTEIIENKQYGINKSYITSAMCTLLSTAENNVIRCTIKDLLETLFIFNKNFFYAKWHPDEVDEQLMGDNAGWIETFIIEQEQKNRRIVRDILNDMADKKLIELNKILKFAKQYRLPNGEFRTKTWDADKETEIPVFLEAQHSVIELFNVSTWQEFENLGYLPRKYGKQIIDDYLFEHLGINYFYYEYEIILNRKDIDDMLLEDLRAAGISFNKIIKSKAQNSKSKNMLAIPKENKDAYIDYLIDVRSK
jgi:hypothetical protein